MRFSYKTLSVRNKLLTGFGVPLALLLAQLMLVNVFIRQLQVAVNMVTAAMAAREADLAATELVTQIRRQASQVSSMPNPLDGVAAMRAYWDEMKSKLEVVQKAGAELDLEAELFEQISGSLERAEKERQGFESVAEQGGDALVERTFFLDESLNDLARALSMMNAGLGDELQASLQREREIHNRLIRGGMLIGLFATVALVGFAWFFAGWFVKPLRVSAERIRGVADGDLSSEDLPAAQQDELGNLTRGINEMTRRLHAIIGSLVDTAARIASASEEMSNAATQQAQGAEEQKNQTFQVAGAMQEMAATVSHVSKNANMAAGAAGQAAETARTGGKIVEETLIKMHGIAESVRKTAGKVQELGKSSDQIGEIIGVIDDIADQTNLLALNAAIEAARAGEQGRGFAVVADEVRKLAERTTQATKEIAQMIKSIQTETKSTVEAMETGMKQVEEGVDSTSQAGASLKDIIQMGERVREMISQIATAATQQLSTTEQVSRNIELISKITADSAASSQQSAKACQNLSTLGLDLQNMVRKFKLKRDDDGMGAGYMAHLYREAPSYPVAEKSNGRDYLTRGPTQGL